MKTWDAIVAGGGVIGLSLALELRRQGAKVLVVERSEPGREASHAAAGMLADCDPHHPQALSIVASASARIYPEFVHQLEDESGLTVDTRDAGTILLGSEAVQAKAAGFAELSGEQLQELEPGLKPGAPASLLPEHSVDPRALMAALLRAAKHRGIEIASGNPVIEVVVEAGKAAAVRTDRRKLWSGLVVNCAGAWASQFGPTRLPTRPVKGQMLSLVAPSKDLLRHVVRAPEVYLVPRSDGRIVVGSTLEEAGFDKRVDADTIRRLYQAAAGVVPELGRARIHEVWAGLRPGTPDDLPILGHTPVEGYFAATGHFRNGILLAPITALLMSQVVRGVSPELDISVFSPARFAT